MSESDAPINQPMYVNPPQNTKMQPVWVTWFVKIVNFINSLVLVPAYPNDATKFLRGDNSWGVPPGTNTYAGPSTQNDVTASRVLGTVYQNTTGKPMFIAVTAIQNSSGQLLGYADTSNPPTTEVGAQYGLTGWTHQVFFIVLPNNYYKSSTDATATLTKWIEWY